MNISITDIVIWRQAHDPQEYPDLAGICGALDKIIKENDPRQNEEEEN